MAISAKPRIGIVTGGGDCPGLNVRRTIYDEPAGRRADGRFDRMVACTGAMLDSVPIADTVGQLKCVPPDGAFVRGARALGIALGD